MRLWVVSLLLGTSGARQEAAPEALAEAMDARLPRFRDAELRYVGRLGDPLGLEIGAESRLLLVPGAGFRTDGTVFLIRAPEGRMGRPVLSASAAERGDDLHFWAVVHGGPGEMLAALPPCLSVRGSRRALGITPDAFPPDFPFRWVYEDALALCALAPREAFARQPGLKNAGRRIVEGRECDVLEAPLPPGKRPPGSILRVLPVGTPVRRFLIETGSGRPWRIELEFSAGEDSLRALWEVTSWRAVEGVPVPDEIEIVLGPAGPPRPDRSWPVVSLRKRLSFCRFNGGRAAGDLLPEGRRKDLALDGGVRPVESCSAAIRKDPGDAAAYAGRAMARYAEAIARAIGGSGAAPRVDPADIVADLEKAREIEPSSAFANLFLLRLYEATGEEKKLSDLAHSMEERTWEEPDVRLALARYRLRSGDPAQALRWTEGDLLSPEVPLARRMEVARVRIGALDRLGRGGEGGRVLADLARSAGPVERECLAGWLVPLREGKDAAGGEEETGLEPALEAALSLEPRNPLLCEMELRRASRAGDPDRMGRALEAYVPAVDDPAALDRAAGLALDSLAQDAGRLGALAPPGVEGLWGKAPGSSNVALLSGLALLKAGRREDALVRLESLLGDLEKQGISREEADRRAGRLALLTRAFGESDRLETALRACRLFVRCVNLSSQPYRFLRGDGTDPISTVVEALLGQSRYGDVFLLLRDLDVQRFDYLHNLRRILRPQEEAFIRSVKEGILEKSADPEDFRKMARLIQRVTTRASEAVPLLERARALAPGDVEILQELAALCMGPAQDRERALRLYEELAVALERTPSPRLSRDQALFMAAHLHHLLGRPAAAAEVLDRIDREAPVIAGSLLTVATIYDQAGRTDRAIAAYRGFVEKFRNHPYQVNSGTYGRLGMLYEKAGNLEEAFRAYVRGIEVQQRERERGVFPSSGPGGPGRGETWDPSVRREALLDRIGRDYFIERFLRGPFEPLAEDEERRLRELRRRLGSDSVAERDEAEAEIRRIGPRAAPHLREGLDSPDPEFRARVRRLLSDWAEPR